VILDILPEKAKPFGQTSKHLIGKEPERLGHQRIS